MNQQRKYDSIPLPMKMRDLTLLAIAPEQWLVVACDSVGAIGSKPQDAVYAPAETVGAFAVRVPLFEIIAAGAQPVLVTDCLSIEMEGAGENIIAGIRAYLREAGLSAEQHVTGSTEENVPTVQTGVGITVLGLCDKRVFYPGTAKAGEVIACAGIPKSAPHQEVRLDDPDILSIQELIHLRKLPVVGDMLPVGSQGIVHEAWQLAKSAGLDFYPDSGISLDMSQSAGPATCVLFTAAIEQIDSIAAQMTAPVQIIGRLQKPKE